MVGPLAIAGIGAAIGLGGSIASGLGSQSSARSLQRQLGPSNALQLQLLQARAKAADNLATMANKLESGEPLTAAEGAFLDSVVKQADLSIEQTRGETVEDVLQTAAGTGFLRGGRTQGQARQTNIEAETSRNQARIAREQEALNRGFRRTVELPAQLRQGILTGAAGQGQTFVPQVSDAQVFGGAAGALGQGLIGFGSQQAAAQTQAGALRDLASQIGTGQGGVTAGGTSVQSGAQSSALQNLFKQLGITGNPV